MQSKRSEVMRPFTELSRKLRSEHPNKEVKHNQSVIETRGHDSLGFENETRLKKNQKGVMSGLALKYQSYKEKLDRSLRAQKRDLSNCNKRNILDISQNAYQGSILSNKQPVQVKTSLRKKNRLALNRGVLGPLEK